MTIELHPNFKKSFKKRLAGNPKLVQKFAERLELFKQDPKSALLKNHGLRGTKVGLRSFAITGDIRVVYEQTDSGIVLYDIGTHNQVY